MGFVDSGQRELGKQTNWGMLRYSILCMCLVVVAIAVVSGAAAGQTSAVSLQEDTTTISPQENENTVYAGGTGIVDNPWQIANWTDLDNVRTNLDANFTLINDLNRTTPGYSQYAAPDANDGSGFDPIGEQLFSPFTGTFDGGGHTIADLAINNSDGDTGLFGALGAGGVATDTRLENATISSDDFYVGGLVGYNDGGTIRNASVSGEVMGAYDVGLLTGRSSGLIEQSTTSGTVIAEKTGDDSGGDIGGLVGRNEAGGLIKSSSSRASIQTKGSSDAIGGLVGIHDGRESRIVNSSATQTATISGDSAVGGLVGFTTNSTVTTSYATADVQGNESVGGIIGSQNNGTVTKSYATGNVSGDYGIGGLIGGHEGGGVSASYATGSVSGIGNVGGLIGYTLTGYRAQITETYATGAVSGSQRTGGLLGRNYAGSRVTTDSYWNVETSGQQTTGGNATGLMTGSMTGDAAETFMPGFNFNTTWSTTATAYPKLITALETPPPISETPPTDPDNDGAYENVDGKLGFNILDVQTLFNNLGKPPVSTHTAQFKFSPFGGGVSVLDVQQLFNELPNPDN
jgi:hypothetical protein